MSIFKQYSIIAITLACIYATPVFAGDDIFCSRVESFDQKLAMRVSERDVRFEKALKEKESALAKARTASTRSITLERERFQKTIARQFEVLRLKAQTSSQKEAVKSFEEAIQMALEARQNAVDRILDEYWARTDAEIASQHAAEKSTVSMYKQKLQNTLRAAKTDCTRGGEANESRSKTISSITGAQEQFEKDKKNLSQFENHIKMFEHERDEALGQTSQTYRDSIGVALENLRAAFLSQ